MEQELVPYVDGLPAQQPAIEELQNLLRSRPFKLPCGAQTIQGLESSQPEVAKDLKSFGFDLDGHFGCLIRKVRSPIHF